MVGSAGDAGNTNENIKPEPPKKPLAKSFHCTNCGGSVTIRYPGASMSVVCENCHSVIDATDDNCRILTKFFKATRTFRPVIPLGERGKLQGRTWEVIGYMVRRDVSSNYVWEEYLLFNPYYGYRWLVEDRGHWMLVKTIKTKPEKHGNSTAYLDSQPYKLYNSGLAQVEYVIGEFYWRVVINSRVTASDYIRPPNMLSMEKDDNEVVWSLGEYISRDEIKKAFGPDRAYPRELGVSPIQPSTAEKKWRQTGMLCLIFWGIITCAQVYFLRTCINAKSLDFVNTFIPNLKKSDITTPVFVLDKDKANVAINISAPVDNSWFWVGGELVNDDTGESYPIDQSVEYYYGTDSDGYWSEGGNSSTLVLSSVPGGKYYINMDIQSGDFKNKYPTSADAKPFEVIVYRDVPNCDNYLWFTFFLTIMPALAWIKMRQIEVARWSNSDFNPYASQSSYNY